MILRCESKPSPTSSGLRRGTSGPHGIAVRKIVMRFLGISAGSTQDTQHCDNDAGSHALGPSNNCRLFIVRSSCKPATGKAGVEVSLEKVEDSREALRRSLTSTSYVQASSYRCR